MAQDERIETREYSQPLGTVFKVMFGYTLRRQWWWFAMTLSAAMCMYLVGAISGNSANGFVAVVGGFLFLMLVFAFPLRMYTKLRRARKHYEVPAKIVFTQEKLLYSDRDGSKAEHPWTKFTFVREFADHFMLHVTSQQYVLVPQSAFEPGEEERLRALIGEKGLLRK